MSAEMFVVEFIMGNWRQINNFLGGGSYGKDND